MKGCPKDRTPSHLWYIDWIIWEKMSELTQAIRLGPYEKRIESHIDDHAF